MGQSYISYKQVEENHQVLLLSYSLFCIYKSQISVHGGIDEISRCNGIIVLLMVAIGNSGDADKKKPTRATN